MKNTITDTTNPTKEDVESLEKDFYYVHVAQDNLLKKLFGFVPEHPGDYSVSRKVYVKAVKEIQKEFHLEEGNPKLVLFVLEQLSRSPKIINSQRRKINK